MTELDDDVVNDALTAEAIRCLSNEANIYLIHDPSDIRKALFNKGRKPEKSQRFKE